MRRRYLLMPGFCCRSLQVLSKANHCDGQRVSVDWPATTETSRKQKFAIAAQLNCVLDGFDRERSQRNQMFEFIFCSFTGDEPCGLLGFVEILKLGFACTSNFTCPGRRQ